MKSLLNVEKNRVPRFWAKVNKDGPVHPVIGTKCWEWTAGKSKSGYGRINLGTRDAGVILAHRMSYVIEYGGIPSGLNVLHKCDNPACVRPDHLFPGTQLENNQDMAKKGRSGPRNHPERMSHGDRHPRTKIPERYVSGIKFRLASGDSQTKIAKEFGVSKSAVWRLHHGLNWKHVE